MPIPLSKTCRHPGCDQAIERTSRSKVCRIHLHRRPYCHCRTCGGLPAPEQPKPRDDVRQVKVAAHSCYSGVVAYTRVTLKREPWEVPA